MDIYDLKPNSHRSKMEANQNAPEERKRVEKVVNGNVKTKKKNGFAKFLGTFLADDVENVKDYALADVIVPALKKAVYDLITGGADMLIYGKGGKGGRRTTAGQISYQNCFSRRDDDRRSARTSDTRFNVDDISFENRGDAQIVLDLMDETLDRYKFVTVADLYDAAGITAPYTASKYGWTDLRSAEVVRTRDGYVIKLPRAVPIE